MQRTRLRRGLLRRSRHASRPAARMRPGGGRRPTRPGQPRGRLSRRAAPAAGRARSPRARASATCLPRSQAARPSSSWSVAACSASWRSAAVVVDVPDQVLGPADQRHRRRPRGRGRAGPTPSGTPTPAASWIRLTTPALRSWHVLAARAGGRPGGRPASARPPRTGGCGTAAAARHAARRGRPQERLEPALRQHRHLGELGAGHPEQPGHQLSGLVETVGEGHPLTGALLLDDDVGLHPGRAGAATLGSVPRGGAGEPEACGRRCSPAGRRVARPAGRRGRCAGAGRCAGRRGPRRRSAKQTASSTLVLPAPVSPVSRNSPLAASSSKSTCTVSTNGPKAVIDRSCSRISCSPPRHARPRGRGRPCSTRAPVCSSSDSPGSPGPRGRG